MVKDLELMKDITILFEKTPIVWGVGRRGKEFLQDIQEMGVGQKDIYLCDSNRALWGEVVRGIKICSPSELHNIVNTIKLEKIVFLVTVESIKSQDEIIQLLEREFGASAVIYTSYAIEWGIYLNLNNSYLTEQFREKRLEEHKIKRLIHDEVMPAKMNILTYFSFCPLHNDEIIVIYQPGKVASSSIYRSIQKYGRYVLHAHMLTGLGDDKDSLYNLLNLKSGKIISLVRDPVARQISAMWQNIHNINRYSVNADFSEIENYYFYYGFENEEFEWFNRQLKAVFHIDIYQHSFNKQTGYTVIQEGNIQLLLVKMEKLDELEKVIGDFLGIEQFQIQTYNVGAKKPYRFALNEYKSNFKLSSNRLQDIYEKNKYMQYFYSRFEREQLYQKWS